MGKEALLMRSFVITDKMVIIYDYRLLIRLFVVIDEFFFGYSFGYLCLMVSKIAVFEAFKGIHGYSLWLSTIIDGNDYERL